MESPAAASNLIPSMVHQAEEQGLLGMIDDDASALRAERWWCCMGRCTPMRMDCMPCPLPWPRLRSAGGTVALYAQICRVMGISPFGTMRMEDHQQVLALRSGECLGC
jgi:hypothetical protein